MISRRTILLLVFAFVATIPLTLLLMRQMVPCVQGGNIYSGEVHMGGGFNTNGIACSVSARSNPGDSAAAAIIVGWISFASAAVYYMMSDLVAWFQERRRPTEDWFAAD